MAKRKKKKSGGPNINWRLEPETKRGIVIIFLLALAIFLFLSFIGLAGSLGAKLDLFLKEALGWDRIFLPMVLLLVSYILFAPRKLKFEPMNYAGLFLFFLFFNALNHVLFFRGLEFNQEQLGRAGGLLGFLVSQPFMAMLGFWGGLVVVLALTIVSFLLIFNKYLNSLARVAGWVGVVLSKFASIFKPIFLLFRREGVKDEDEEAEEYEETEPEPETAQSPLQFASRVVKTKIQRRIQAEEDFPSALPTRVRAKIDIPLDLLSRTEGKPTSGDIKANQEIIRRTLQNFGVEVDMGEVSVGPTVTQYTLAPASGVKIAKITTLNNDLALALAAHPIRIEAPIPGKSLVGIEVPNQSVAIVRLRQVLDSKEFKTRKNNLFIALGKDVAGKPHLSDLGRMPHLLVAGATGSGKTVCLNSIIVSLLYENSPDELKLVLIDPKRVELPVYNGLPHLLTPVVTTVDQTVNALRWTIREMEKRFGILSSQGARDIYAYNARHEEKIPFIVVVIDELADLMAAAANEVEAAIIRLAQMSRAVGIHLVLATQRPSVDVITGLIKANVPARIAFAVASLMDSRTILDTSGAEKLLGRGDMLYTAAEISKPKRLQGAFVNDQEIKNVVDFIKNKYDPVSYNNEVLEKSSSATSFGISSGDGDTLLPEAVQVIFQAGKGSASLLQRRLKVGYARAARLLDIMEEQGIIGPADGAKPRELLISSLDDLEAVAAPSDYEDDEEEEAEEQIPEPADEPAEDDDDEEEEDEEETEDDEDDEEGAGEDKEEEEGRNNDDEETEDEDGEDKEEEENSWGRQKEEEE